MLALAPQGSHQPHTPHTLVRPERQHRTASSRTDRRPPSVTTAPTDPPTTSTPAVPAAATPTVSHAQPTRPAVVAMQRLADGSLDLGSYPSTDLLRLLAALLTQITTENDKLRPEPTPHTPLTPPTDPVPDASRPPIWSHLTTASRNALGTPAATLAFHARNIPSISIEQYLLRILKYCPTTNEVFLGLLIYFDRMSKLASDCALPGSSTPHRTLTIDSYNIHRLLIAGVTVASKFFSDVFYTNSRYAKVGGLPQTELNQLELHFLLLNDFRLSIPIDEMQRYAEQLLRYSAGMSPEDAFSPSATAPPPAPAPPTEPHRPAHLQLRPNPTSPVAAGHSPGHLSTSFSANTFPKTSHHDIEGRAWNAASNSHRSSQVASDAASIYSVDASESGYGSTTDSDTIRAHWSSAESEMTEDGADRDEP